MAKQPQKPKSLQDIFRERQMKDLKREYYFQRINQFWTATKRLALVGLLGYGTFWGSKPENRQTLKSFLKSRSAPIEQRIGNFKEGVNMIKDGLRQDKNAQAYHEEQQRRIKEYRDMGIDPVVKYAESGTKEYREELEFYRKSGVFRGGRD